MNQRERNIAQRLWAATAAYEHPDEARALLTALRIGLEDLATGRLDAAEQLCAGLEQHAESLLTR